MAIKMRNNTQEDAVCYECGEEQKNVLNMYDMCIGDTIFTFCDECNEKILDKCLKAVCERNHRTKTPRDMAVIRRRKWKNDPHYGGFNK